MRREISILWCKPAHIYIIRRAIHSQVSAGFFLQSTFTYTHNATYFCHVCGKPTIYWKSIFTSLFGQREFAKKKVEIGRAACGAAESAAINRTSLCNFQQFSRTQKATSLIHPNTIWSAQRFPTAAARNHLPRTDNRIGSISLSSRRAKVSSCFVLGQSLRGSDRPSLSTPHTSH
jgi:hypothetical protein